MRERGGRKGGREGKGEREGDVMFVHICKPGREWEGERMCNIACA